MANRHEIHLQAVIFISCFLPLECVTSLTCGTSVNTITLNQPLETFKYPASGRYPKTTTCEWLFESPDTEARLIYEVTNIYVDRGDTLKFNDGSKVFCISSCGGSQPSKTTPENRLSVKLMTDGTENSYEIGFTVVIVVGKDESNCSNSGTIHNIAIAKQTTLTSPNFPEYYPKDHICTYTYTYIGGNVKFEFIYLRVEKDSGNCFDYVEIFNGSSISSPLIAKVCGDTVPAERYVSSDTSLTIRFTSDEQVTKQGFLAYLTPVAKPEPTSIVTNDTTTESMLTTMESSQTSISTMESSQTSISPTMESSQTSIPPTTESSQTSISPSMESSQTSIPLTTMESSQTSMESSYTSLSPTMDSSQTSISPTMESSQTSIAQTMESNQTSISTTMESSKTSISSTTESSQTSTTQTTESSQTSISPTMESSQTSISTTVESSQTLISSAMESSETSIPPTTESSQTSISPTMESSQTSISPTMESSQTSKSPTTKSSVISTSEGVLQILDKFKGPLIGGSVVLLLAIITIFVFILSKYRTSQNKKNVKKEKRDDLLQLFGGLHASNNRLYVRTYEGYLLYSYINKDSKRS